MRTITEQKLKDSPESDHSKATLRFLTREHAYMFNVNNILIMDTKYADWATNGYGSLNSVLHV
ncbi:MAG: hypothetical protein A2283_14560 [Lentisphaerae bacterium RIFOXYA12_FULL_48_11]|nr:MAG: hypothetical protein A2283_14560 [Lentisphaerae bacterium RIFOXYA12_FULL_48_11]